MAKELADRDRAHSGIAGAKPRHGQDALGKVKFRAPEVKGYDHAWQPKPIPMGNMNDFDKLMED